MNTKHIPLTLAIAGALSANAAWAQTKNEDITIYGRLDVSMDSRFNNKDSILSQTDNASRLGFKGSRSVSGGLDLYYGFEMGISADNGSYTSPEFRNAYAGLGTPYGKFAMGRLDSANPTGSPLYSQITKNVAFVIHDAGATAIGTSVLNARNRTSNSIGYMSPTFSGFDVRARYYLFGGSSSATTTPGTGLTEADLKQMDIGLNYNQESWGVGLGYGVDSKAGGFANNDFQDKVQLVGSYKLGDVKLSAVLGEDRYKNIATTRDKVQYQLLGVSTPIGSSGTIIANLMERDVQADRKGKFTRFQIGYSHKIDKNASAYVLWDTQDPNTNVSSNEFNTVSVGVQFNF